MNASRISLSELFPDRERRKLIWGIALPIMGGMMSQNVLNLVDIAMVGRLGDAALAATGIGSFANYLAMAFIIGLSAGVQALAARRLGEGRDAETAIPLNGGLLLALAIGLPLGILLVLATPWAFTFLTDDPQVRELGTPYLQVRIASIIAVGMNFSFRGYWSAIHMTGVYLRTLLLMHALNIFLNWVLIFGKLGAPALGVYGAGLATTLSLYLGTALYFLFAWRHARDKGFLDRVPSRDTLWQQVIGDDHLAIAFDAARSADPSALLFYDDFYDDLAVTQDAVANGVAIAAGATADQYGNRDRPGGGLPTGSRRTAV